MTSFPLYFYLPMRMSFTDVKYEEITFSVQFPSFIVQKLSLFTLPLRQSRRSWFTSKLMHFRGSKNELEILQIALASTLCPLYFGFRYIKILEGHVAAARKRSHQWCVTPNNAKTMGRMTCHCFQRPIRRDLTSSSYTTDFGG